MTPVELVCSLTEIADVAEFERCLKQGGFKNRNITFLNPVSFFAMGPDHSMLREFDFAFSDGILFSSLAKLLGKSSVRLSFDFSSIAGVVFDFARNKQLRVTVVGGVSTEAVAFRKYIEKRFPGVWIQVFDGFSASEECSAMNVEIREFCPDILIVGMGAGRQERYILELRAEGLSNCICFTCGGFISQTASRGDYYSPFVKVFGLRWVQRAILHPHVRRRLFREYPIFLSVFAWELFKGALSRRELDQNGD